MKKLSLAAAASLALAAPAFAESHELALQGDAANGEEQFNRQCVACHVVQNDEGEIIAGRRAKTGPNLYGVAYRQPGTVEGFRYGKSMVAYGETGAVWDEESFAAYVQDPTAYLREALDDKKARGKMAYKVREASDALDLFAYLVSIGPELDMEMIKEKMGDGS